jgi:hypothetical protein
MLTIGAKISVNECTLEISAHSYSVNHPLLCATEYGRDDLLGISLAVSKGKALRRVQQRCRAMSARPQDRTDGEGIPLKLPDLMHVSTHLNRALKAGLFSCISCLVFFTSASGSTDMNKILYSTGFSSA